MWAVCKKRSAFNVSEIRVNAGHGKVEVLNCGSRPTSMEKLLVMSRMMTRSLRFLSSLRSSSKLREQVSLLQLRQRAVNAFRDQHFPRFVAQLRSFIFNDVLHDLTTRYASWYINNIVRIATKSYT